MTQQNKNEERIEFFKFLASNCEVNEVYLTIPETVIIGYGFQSPILLYNDEKGVVRVQKNLNNMHFKLLIELFEVLRQKSSQEVCPLAIKKELESYHNRIIMKSEELAFEWKYAYKIDVILQRFICNKGCKASKISVSSSKELKVFKIINKSRNDLNTVEGASQTQKRIRFSLMKKSQKNSLQIFFKNLIFRDNNHNFRVSIKPDVQDLGKISLQRAENSCNALLVPKSEFSCISNKTPDRLAPSRKSMMIAPETTTKKTIFTLSDYLKTCTKKSSFRSIQEIITDLKFCKSQDCELDFQGDEGFYVNNFKEKIKAMYSVNSKNLDSIDTYEIRSENKLKKLGELINVIRRVLNSQLYGQGKTVSTLWCDFVEDPEKTIYFIGIKSFETVPVKIQNLKRFQSFNRALCPGKYCKGNPKRVLNKLSYTLMKKDLHADKCQGLSNASCLDQVKVCRYCYDEYKSVAALKKNNSMAGLRLKTFEKSEIKSLLDEINPISASETCKIVHKNLNLHVTTASTTISENQLQKERTVTKQEQRLNYFKNKIREIQIASYEDSFIKIIPGKTK